MEIYKQVLLEIISGMYFQKVFSVFFLSFCFFLKEWQGQEGEGLICDLQQSKFATSIFCQFHC